MPLLDKNEQGKSFHKNNRRIHIYIYIYISILTDLIHYLQNRQRILKIIHIYKSIRTYIYSLNSFLGKI
jgi:hypothetical protein